MEISNPDLIFNVAQLLKEPLGSTRKIDVGTPDLQLSDPSTEPGGAAAVAGPSVAARTEFAS